MTTDDPAKKRLGRGLAALIGEMDKPVEPAEKAATGDGRIPIEQILANPANPRRSFSRDDLADLSNSIREHGVVQPVVVRPASSGAGYQIIAGERRWRAAQQAGLADVPVIIRDVDDRLALELAIVENVQRADLNALEEAKGYQQLIDDHGYTQAELAKVIGKSRSHIANTLRLLSLPEAVSQMLVDGRLSAGHARTLIGADNPAGLAQRIVSEDLSVRQAEQLARNGEGSGKPVAPKTKDADIAALEKSLSDRTGFSVSINHRGRAGALTIRYKTMEQLDNIIHKLNN